MNEKLDLVLNKLGDLFDTWLGEFQSNPVRTTLKVLLILYVIKVAKKVVKDIR
jgi:hypothetical protein